MTFLPDFGSRDWSLGLRNGRDIHGGAFSGPGDHSGPISGNFRRFRARPTFCDLNIATIETSETSALCVETRQMSVPATQEMSAAETGQMSSAETRQMSTVLVRQGAALSHYFTSVLFQQKTSVLSQQQTSVLSQQQTSVLSLSLIHI